MEHIKRGASRNYFDIDDKRPTIVDIRNLKMK